MSGKMKSFNKRRRHDDDDEDEEEEEEEEVDSEEEEEVTINNIQPSLKSNVSFICIFITH